MTALGFTLFDTAIGRCGIAWSERGVVGVQLPESHEDQTRVRLQRRFPQASEIAPPGDVQKALKRIATLLHGEPADLSAIALDMEGLPEFNRRVYEIARGIPRGATCTYGEIAARLGGLEVARAVGQALGQNPFVIIVPCHRVLAAGNRIGGFSAAGGTATKLRLLTIEGALAADTLPLFDSARL